MKNNTQKFNRVLIIGSLLILTGLLCNEWTLASLLSSDGVVALSKRIIIWIFDLLLIATGAFLIAKRKKLDIKRLLYFCYSIALLLLIVELGLHVTDYVIHFGKEKELDDKKYLLSPYKGKEWAKALYEEYDQMTGDHKEFREWGKNEFHGKYVDIDSNGVRKTWNPDDYNGKKPKTLYMFGASATWGFGARDEYTVPSFISKELNGKNYAFKVSNYGEWGYAFSQELFYLITLLKDGHRPDYVMFYSWTDIYNAYQSGRPGTLHFDFSMRTRMKELSDIQHIMLGVKNMLSKYSKIYREIVKWNKKLDPPESLFTEVAHNYSDDELKKLLKSNLEHFSNLYELLDNLSKIYHFKYMSFWLPTLFTEEKLTDEETTVESRLQDKTLTKMFIYANDAYKTNSHPHFYNITDALKGRKKTYYLDFGHLSEEGNEVIAKRIVSIFEKEHLRNEQ